MDLTVRHVRAAEAERIRALRLRALAADPDGFASTHAAELAAPSERWAGWANASEVGSDQRTFVLADRHDGWWGLALVRRLEEAPDIAGLYSMWIDPAARGRSASRVLCRACASWGATRGIRELELGVFAANERACRAYAAVGFVVIERRMWTSGERELELLVMRRPV